MPLLFRPPNPLRILGIAAAVAIFFFVLRLYTPASEDHDRLSSAIGWLLPTAPAQPPQAPVGIPEKLWYKLGPKGLTDNLRGYTDSCIASNPTFQHEFLTDESGDQFVRDRFASHPNIVDGFLAIRIPIIKADLLRYLVLYHEGGVWNDLDVSCEVPISEWVPEQYEANASIVVGMEFDVDIWVRQFASWTIMARPNSTHMLTVVEDCLEGLASKAKELGVGLQDLRIDMIDDIVDVSGPRRLTRGILKSLSQTLGQEIGNDDVAHILEPKLIGDVLVMPDYAFADSMNQQYGDKKVGRILAVHHYAGSWKNANGGEEAG